MKDGKSKAVKVKAHHHRRRHSSKHGKKAKEEKVRKQDKIKVKNVAKIQKESDDDSSSGTLFTPIKKSSESPKKCLGQLERAQLKKKLQLINRCLECLKKQKWKVMQQLEALDDGDGEEN